MTKNNGNGNGNRGLVTCVRLSRETRDKLADMGKKTQTFDEIVTDLITKSNEPCGEVVAGENKSE